MSTATFDTLKFTEQLIEAGYTDQQAKGTVRAYQTAHEGLELATKIDVELLRRDMREMEHRLLTKLITLMAGISVFTVTAGVSFIVWFIENHSKI